MRGLILTTLALASLNAQAGDSPFYIGAGIGLTDLSLKLDVGPNGSHDINDELLSGQLFAGYHIADRWSVELGYTDFGENDADNQLFLESPLLGPPFNLEIEASGYYLNGQYHYPASEDTSIDLTLGYFDGEATARNSLCCGVFGSGTVIGEISEDDSGFMAGIGLTVDMTEQLDLRVNATYYSVDFDKVIEEPWRVGVDLIWDF